MFSVSPFRSAWWNFSNERMMRHITLMGGTHRDTPVNSTHRVYVKKYRRGAFPNRTRSHWTVTQNGIAAQRPKRVPWPYDISSMIFNGPRTGADKMGYVVGTSMFKTAVVATDHLVYYPKFNQRVAKTSRFFAHDEDMATVEGDLVHIKQCRRISKYKQYYVFSILEPNVEGRERLKLGLPAVPPPLFGYPTSRRVVKMNLASQEGTKKKAAAALQEQLQDFYRFAGRVSDTSVSRLEDNGDTFDDVAKMIAPNAPQTELNAETQGRLEGEEAVGETFNNVEHDTRKNKGEESWMGRSPADKYDYAKFTKSA